MQAAGSKHKPVEGQENRRGATGADAGGGGAGGSASATAAAAKKRKVSKPAPGAGKNKLTMRDRLALVKEVQEGGVRATVAKKYGVSKACVTQLMKPDQIAKLEAARDMELNPEALRLSKPEQAELEKRLLQWVKIARDRFVVRAGVGYDYHWIGFLFTAVEV